jgi:hypothetical protein
MMTSSRDVRSRIQGESTALAEESTVLAEESTVLVVPLLEVNTVLVAESTAPAGGSTALVAWLEATSTVEMVESNLQTEGSTVWLVASIEEAVAESIAVVGNMAQVQENTEAVAARRVEGSCTQDGCQCQGLAYYSLRILSRTLGCCSWAGPLQTEAGWMADDCLKAWPRSEVDSH